MRWARLDHLCVINDEYESSQRNPGEKLMRIEIHCHRVGNGSDINQADHDVYFDPYDVGRDAVNKAIGGGSKVL